MKKTKIDWCDSTWNPVTGCRHGCGYCYARRITERFGGYDGYGCEEDANNVERGNYVLKTPAYIKRGKGKRITNAPFPFKFEPTLHRYRLNEPLQQKKPQTIFVCSMADLFGDWVPDAWIDEVFAACERAPQHNYIFLTKNPARYIELAKKDLLPDRHWYGYSATRQSELWEFEHADECPVKNLFVSIEPILESVTPRFSTHVPADWVIIGAETGNRKGKVVPHLEWIEEIVTECEYSGIPVFMKESLAPIWGEPLIQEFPDGLMRRENKA